MVSGQRLASSLDFRVTPDQLDGIKIVAVGREGVGRPARGAARRSRRRHRPGSVQGQAVPDERVSLSLGEMLVEVLEELDQGILVVGAGPHLE